MPALDTTPGEIWWTPCARLCACKMRTMIQWLKSRKLGLVSFSSDLYRFYNRGDVFRSIYIKNVYRKKFVKIWYHLGHIVGAPKMAEAFTTTTITNIVSQCGAALCFHECFLNDSRKILPGALLLSFMFPRLWVHIHLCHWLTLWPKQIHLISLSPSVFTWKWKQWDPSHNAVGKINGESIGKCVAANQPSNTDSVNISFVPQG